MAASILFEGKSLEFRQEFWKQKKSSHTNENDFRREMKMLDFSGTGVYCNQFTFDINEGAVRGYYTLRDKTNPCNKWSLHAQNLRGVEQKVYDLKGRMSGKGYKIIRKGSRHGESIQHGCGAASVVAKATHYADYVLTATFNAVNYVPVIDPLITPSIKVVNTTVKLGYLLAKGARGWDGLAVSFLILDVCLTVRLEKIEKKRYKLSYSFKDNPSGACTDDFSVELSSEQIWEFFKCCFAFVMEPKVGVLIISDVKLENILVGHTLSMQECISSIQEGKEFWKTGWTKKDMVFLGKLDTKIDELDAMVIINP